MTCPTGLSWSTSHAACQPAANVNCRNEIKCPKGWTLFGDSCYLLSRDKVSTLADAEAVCESHGSKLVEINTKEENKIFLFYLPVSFLTIALLLSSTLNKIR